jgi:hypothetical protein
MVIIQVKAERHTKCRAVKCQTAKKEQQKRDRMREHYADARVRKQKQKQQCDAINGTICKRQKDKQSN